MVKRLTYHSGLPDNITNQSDKTFSTVRIFKNRSVGSFIPITNPKGAERRTFSDAVAHDPTLSPDGRFLRLCMVINPARKDYEGSSNREL
jgi:hypothetical protein